PDSIIAINRGLVSHAVRHPRLVSPIEASLLGDGLRLRTLEVIPDKRPGARGHDVKATLVAELRASWLRPRHKFLGAVEQRPKVARDHHIDVQADEALAQVLPGLLRECPQPDIAGRRPLLY